MLVISPQLVWFAPLSLSQLLLTARWLASGLRRRHATLLVNTLSDAFMVSTVMRQPGYIE